MLDHSHLRTVPLPEGLTPEQVFQSLQQTQDFFQEIRRSTGIILSQIIQSNNFSGVISNVFTRKLHDNSDFKTGNEQRYPDLLHIHSHIGLEVKASNKPMKGGEGHNGHSGWHIIVCYAILPNGDIEFSQVEIADLIGFENGDASDWKYQGSRRNNDSQRTETYITTNVGTAKLRDGTLYLNPNLVPITPAMLLARHRLAHLIPVPDFSPFHTHTLK